MNKIKRISEISINNGMIDFKCTSKEYGTTDAGGKVEDAIKNGFASLGDGNSYKFSEDEIKEIKIRISPHYAYYMGQFRSLVFGSTLDMQIVSDGSKTKWMNINVESIQAMIDFLKEYNYIPK